MFFGLCYYLQVKRYDILLIDADDTIMVFDEAEDRVFCELVESLKLSDIPDLFPTWQRINKEFWQDLDAQKTDIYDSANGHRFDLLFSELGINVNARKANILFHDLLSHNTLLVEHADEVVRELAGKYHLYCITNGLYSTQLCRLAANGLGRFFRDIFVSESMGCEKPEIAYFEMILSKLGNPDKSRILIIGDTLNTDIQGGISSGIDTCWFNPLGKIRPSEMAITYEINDLRKLRQIL